MLCSASRNSGARFRVKTATEILGSAMIDALLREREHHHVFGLGKAAAPCAQVIRELPVMVEPPKRRPREHEVARALRAADVEVMKGFGVVGRRRAAGRQA